MPTQSAEVSTVRTRPYKTRLIDIAKEAGVSVSVVGCVLNGGGGNTRVAQQTAERIVAIADRLNYRASPTAQQLRGKRSNVFGLLVASAGDPLTSFLVEHLDEEVVTHGCQTLIGNTALAPGRFEASVDEFVSRGVDGIFCIVHNIFPGDRAALLARCPNTVFYCDPGLPNATFVEVDQGEVGRLSAEYLLSRGRQRIGFAILDPAIPLLQDRMNGLRSAYQQAKVPLSSLAVFEGSPGSAGPVRPDERTMLWQTAEPILDQIIDQLVVQHRADAIVAHSDFIASALLKRMRARGIRVPKDVAIVGYLNHYLCDYVDPPLTSIDLNHHLAAKAMVNAVQQMVEQGPSAASDRGQILISPRVIARESA
jgi:LacI family transcriptional regulator